MTANNRVGEARYSFFRRVRIPLAVLVIGLALTAVMASFQQESVRREQELLFERQVNRELTNFEDHIAVQVEMFEDAVGFIETTFPVSELQYRRFFADSMFGGTDSVDPGIAVIEAFSPNRIEDLEARERGLGNLGFSVAALGQPVNGMHFVITRTAEPAAVLGLPLTGLDISGITSQDLLRGLPVDGRQTFTLGADTPLGQLFASADAEVEGLPVVVLVESLNNPLTNEVLGWAAWFIDPMSLVDGLNSEGASSNVAIEMFEVLLARIDADQNAQTSFENASLTRRVDIETQGLSWTVSLWADDGFGVGTGLFDQREVWTFGLLATLALMIVAVWRVTYGVQLVQANFELEHALTLAHTDPLTGLLNRQGFVEAVDNLQTEDGGTIFFIDLDGFKNVNDSLGHAAGDQVLREVSRCLREQFRNSDLLCRYGGDEFVIYTPGLTTRQAQRTSSERIVASVNQCGGSVTCSLGSAVRLRQTDRPVEILLREADEAMYRAKQAGGGVFEAAMSADRNGLVG